MTWASLYIMDSAVDSSLATEGFRGCFSKQTHSWHVSVAHFQWRHLVVKPWGQTKERPPHSGEPCRSDMKDFNQGASFIPFLWLRGGHKHSQSQSQTFFPPGQLAVSPCGNCSGFTGRTNACSCVLSGRAPTVARSTAPRWAAIQQLNGSHLQDALCCREQASQAGFMNSFKSSC